jgi:nucleoporin NUP82
MPKIISHTPAWLSRPSPGFDLFSPDNKKLSSELPKLKAKQPTNGTKKKDEWLGPNCILAKKGTEVFVVVDNTIRWADLRLLKENWESREQSDTSSVSSGFRVGTLFE